MDVLTRGDKSDPLVFVLHDMAGLRRECFELGDTLVDKKFFVARHLLSEDLRPFVEADLIQAWFWGDEHFAALYEPNDEMRFVGSCIGHGGYPFSTKRDDSSDRDVARLVWTETGSRFEAIEGLRQDRGNNGFCHLTLDADQIELRYIDWRFRTRKEVALRPEGNRLRID